jgi:hypothetical protein
MYGGGINTNASTQKIVQQFKISVISKKKKKKTVGTHTIAKQH